MLPIGTRIRFKHTITEDATGDHPTFLMAKKGEYGEITGYTPPDLLKAWQNHGGLVWQYAVKWDGYLEAGFFANEGDDFEVAPVHTDAEIQQHIKDHIHPADMEYGK